MPTNEYLPIANNGGANVVSQADYLTAVTAGGTLEDGYLTGVAKSPQMNKTWRQSSVVSSAIGKLIVDVLSVNAPDDGDVAALKTLIYNAIAAVAAASVGTGFTTGDAKLTLKTTADSGWVMSNDGTIGDASSGATTRANADCSALFTLLWNNITDAYAPVSGGRGGSAAADFAAHKTIALTKNLGRALAVSGAGSVVFSGVVGDVNTGADTLTLPANNTKAITGMAVLYAVSGGTITGLTGGNTYYLIRASTTTVRLASTLANAQNSVAIDLTATVSSPAWTLTYSLTSRALGETVGEEAHALSLTELLAHAHSTLTSVATAGSDAPFFDSAASITGGSTSSAGGNAAMNIMQPSSFWNVMLKL